MSVAGISSTAYASGLVAAQNSSSDVLSSLVGQLEQSIAGGDLNQTQIYLTAINENSPSSISGNNALGTFLTSVTTALNDGSTSEAQSALDTYQSATASTTSSAGATTATTVDPEAAAQAASALIEQNFNQQLVSSVLDLSPQSSDSTDLSGLTNILTSVYGTSSSDSSATSAASSSTSDAATGYDTLLSALQGSLSSGNVTAAQDAVNAYLSSFSGTGNFVDTQA